MNLFNLSLHLNGYPINKAKRVLKTIQEKDETQFEAYLSSKKKEIVDYHLKNNSFYKSFGRNIDLNDWGSVPVMTKSDLQQPLSTLLSDNFKLSNVYIDKTSGASGEPFIFAKDRFCHAMTWAVIQDRFSWYGLDFNSSKQARFYGIPYNKKDFYIEKAKDFVSNRTRFNVFDLSDVAFDKWVQTFKVNTFEYMNGYTSPMVQFAKFLKRKNIILKAICPSLDICITTSEMLFDEDKLLMETQFGVSVVNEYGASELDLIAFQNTDDEFQLNSETLFVEILDESNNPLPYGQEGRIVISSLYNKAQTFIRYDIGDAGIMSGKSSLQKPILKKLTGRTNDIALLPSGKKAAGLTFYYVTKSIIEDDGNVKEFVIEQLTQKQFLVKYVSNSGLTNVKKDYIAQEMERYLEPNLQISFKRLNVLQRSKSGKLKQFVSHLSPNK